MFQIEGLGQLDDFRTAKWLVASCEAYSKQLSNPGFEAGCYNFGCCDMEQAINSGKVRNAERGVLGEEEVKEKCGF